MAHPGSRPAYRYRIDSSDRVDFVSDAWLDFAAENEAAELTRDAVVGSSIWSCIQDQPTRDLYRTLFEKVRSGERTLSVPFRCDAPDRYRFMRLEMSPGRTGAIELAGRLLREQVRVYLPVLDRVIQRADYGFPICSLCKQVFASGAWLELEDAIAQLGKFDSTRVPRLEPTLCDACRALPEGLVEGGSAA